MKKIFFLLLFLSFPSFGGMISVDTAVLQGMDKVTGRVRKLTLPVGSSIDFGELTIAVDKCLTRTPEETPENASFLHVIQKERELFSGWMFSSNPALSAMEDPVYDIWLVSCISKDSVNKSNDKMSSEIIEDINENEIED